MSLVKRYVYQLSLSLQDPKESLSSSKSPITNSTYGLNFFSGDLIKLFEFNTQLYTVVKLICNQLFYKYHCIVYLSEKQRIILKKVNTYETKLKRFVAHMGCW